MAVAAEGFSLMTLKLALVAQVVAVTVAMVLPVAVALMVKLELLILEVALVVREELKVALNQVVQVK